MVYSKKQGHPWWSSPQDSTLPMQGAQVWSPVRELDPACRNQEPACSNQKIPHTATKILRAATKDPEQPNK